MSREESDWQSSKGVAKAILRDRPARRKVLEYSVAITLSWMSVGLWIIDEWLEKVAIRYMIWWGICGLFSIILICLALLDALAVIREERSKR